MIAKLIDYFGCGPSEEIFLAMLNHNYDTEWLELDISLGNSWVANGFDFSVSAADSFASTMEEYFDGENYLRGLDPDGSLKLLSDMGFDFEEDSYAILFSAIQDKNLSAEEIKYVIEQQGAWNARNDDGETLLMHIAAYTEPDKGLVEFMLDGGADIAFQSGDPVGRGRCGAFVSIRIQLVDMELGNHCRWPVIAQDGCFQSRLEAVVRYEGDFVPPIPEVARQVRVPGVVKVFRMGIDVDFFDNGFCIGRIPDRKPAYGYIHASSAIAFGRRESFKVFQVGKIVFYGSSPAFL